MPAENGNGAGHWVAPFEKYPEFRVQVKELSLAEETAIADQFKVGRRVGDLTPRYQASRELIRRKVVGWEGVPEIVQRQLGLTNMVTDEAKDLFADPVFFDSFDPVTNNPVRKSLWTIVDEARSKEREIDLKNF